MILCIFFFCFGQNSQTDFFNLWNSVIWPSLVSLVSRLHILNGKSFQHSGWHKRSFIFKQILKPSLPSRLWSEQNILQISFSQFLCFPLFLMNTSWHAVITLRSDPLLNHRNGASLSQRLKRSRSWSGQTKRNWNGPTSCHSAGFSHPCCWSTGSSGGVLSLTCPARWDETESDYPFSIEKSFH